jgi:hypothetical protein
LHLAGRGGYGCLDCFFSPAASGRAGFCGLHV